MPDLVYIALAIGALGMIMAIWALIALRRLRHELAKPRLSTKLTWVSVDGLPTGTIRLDIWNAGRTPVTIRKAQLLWKDSSDGKATGSLGFAPYDPYGKSMTQTVDDHVLQPCEGSNYILPPLPPSMMRVPAELPEDKVWISIQGGSAEVARIAGGMVKPLLERYLETSP